MIVLGFNWPVAHDHGVAAIIDGELVFATEEERFTRVKHSPSQPPIRSLIYAYKYLRSNYGVNPDEIDAYAVNWDPRFFSRKDRIEFLNSGFKRLIQYSDPSLYSLKDLVKTYVLNRVSGNYLSIAKHLIYIACRSVFNKCPSNPKIIPVYHHLTHAATAYYFSGFNRTAIIVADGSGETISTSLWIARDGEFEALYSIKTEDISLGVLYQHITKKIRLGYLEGPGKAMGLAPYGKYNEKICRRFQKFIPITKYLNKGLKEGKIWIEYRNYLYDRIVDSLTTDLDLEWDPHGKLKQEVADLAWCIQNYVEESMVSLAQFLKDQTGETNLALAGGVALNARANMRIYYSNIFSDIFIFPVANDAGTPIGAAAYVYEHILGGKIRSRRLDHVYFGFEYSEEEIANVVKKGKWNYEYIGEDINPVIDLVLKGGVVSWYQGRSEIGPRALGHRSIIADPRNKEMWKKVNEIKGREWWRPLAPSLVLEDASRYFYKATHHPFMILMFKYKDEETCRRVPAVCHIDLTARPQTVTGNEDRNWYNLIRAFKDETGEGIILNTSFNLAGEPLVESPYDAIKSFAFGGFDALYIQGWLIRKKGI